jgi:hypothetical protein
MLLYVPWDLPFQAQIQLKLQVLNQISAEQEKKVFRKRLLNSEPAIRKTRSPDSIMCHPQNKLLIDHA